MPVWLLHGDADRIVPVSESRAVADALRARGADVRLTEYAGVGHESWVPAYDDPQVAHFLVR